MKVKWKEQKQLKRSVHGSVHRCYRCVALLVLFLFFRRSPLVSIFPRFLIPLIYSHSHSS